MDIDEIVFDTFVICPICKRKMKSLTSAHLQHKHSFAGLKEFKIAYGIPMGVPLVARDVRTNMQIKGKRRSKWFKENVMPIGIELSKKGDLVPKELRKHGGNVRRGKNWHEAFKLEMREDGWIDLHEAAKQLGISYNYARKCASDGRLRTMEKKGVRFTSSNWIREARNLLQENRKKYRPDLLKK